MFVDASFAGDIRDSKSTSGMVMYLMGPNTCVPLSWMCKKQGCQSHSSTEAEVISLDAGLRMEGLSALAFWDEVISVFHPDTPRNTIPKQLTAQLVDGHLAILSQPTPQPPVPQDVIYHILQMVDWVPPNLPPHPGFARLVILEDNDAVIKMLKKGRAPAMTHVARTHRVNLDWLLERSFVDPCVHGRYIDTASQLADILTKPHFSASSWCQLCTLFRLGFKSLEKKLKGNSVSRLLL